MKNFRQTEIRKKHFDEKINLKNFWRVRSSLKNINLKKFLTLRNKLFLMKKINLKHQCF